VFSQGRRRAHIPALLAGFPGGIACSIEIIDEEEALPLEGSPGSEAEGAPDIPLPRFLGEQILVLRLPHLFQASAVEGLARDAAHLLGDEEGLVEAAFFQPPLRDGKGKNHVEGRRETAQLLVEEAHEGPSHIFSALELEGVERLPHPTLKGKAEIPRVEGALQGHARAAGDGPACGSAAEGAGRGTIVPLERFPAGRAEHFTGAAASAAAGRVEQIQDRAEKPTRRICQASRHVQGRGS